MSLPTETMKSVKTLSEKTDRVLLFHSANGKDSIALLEMLSPYFKEVRCIYMYMVRDLSHIKKYILWAEKRYKNARFTQTPHYAYYNYKKLGVCGTTEVNYAQYNLSTITEKIREETRIQWAVYGFKQNDSLNRRLMLRSYKDEIINEDTQKIYPLSQWSNKEVLQYISKKRLIKPLQYGTVGNTRRQGTDVTNLSFLLWCRANAPEDLIRVIKEFPDTERILFEYDYEKQNKAV